MATLTTAHTPRTHLVSLAAAAEQFGVSVQTLRRRIADGTITGYRVGRLIRVDPDEAAKHLLVTIPSLSPRR